MLAIENRNLLSPIKLATFLSQSQLLQEQIEAMFRVIQRFLQKHCFHPLSLPLILSLIFLYRWLYKNPTTSRNLPPSPPKLPILGNLHQLGEFPHRSLHSMSRKFGELMLLQVGSKPTLIVSSADAAQEIMKTHDIIFANRPKSRIMSRIIYGGNDIVFSPYGEYWRQIKSICVLQLLNNKKVRSFQNIREEETALMVEKIKRSMLSPVNLSEILLTICSDLLCRTGFGRKYSADEGGTNFNELLNEFVEVMGVFSMGDFVPWLGWIDQVTGLDSRVEKVANDFDEFLEKVVQEHENRRNTNSTDDEACKGENRDFVDILLDVQRENRAALPKDSIKAIVLDMFAAGTDTTYTLLVWAMTELLRHPRVMKELQDEVRGIVRGKGRVDEDDLEKMKYLKAVIKEILRLHPPLPLLLFREASQDVKVNGYDIAAKTQVIVNAWAIQRDPASWEEPEEFCPNRFLNSSIDVKGQDFQLIPFGSGRRGCPGISFALVDAELVLANLSLFDWKLPGGVECETSDLPERGGVTVSRRDPLVVIAHPCS